jgi:hypothetical protein
LHVHGPTFVFHQLMTKQTKRKSIFTAEDLDEVSITFPTQNVDTREFLTTTVEDGPLSITTTKHTTRLYKPQPQPASIDPSPRSCLEDEESTPVDATQVSPLNPRVRWPLTPPVFGVPPAVSVCLVRPRRGRVFNGVRSCGPPSLQLRHQRIAQLSLHR